MNHDPIELAWCAGFMDGEGCFRGMRRKDSKTVRPDIQVVQREDNEEVLLRLQAALGGKIRAKTERAQRARGVNARDCLVIRWTGADAILVGNLLYCQLGSKKRADIDAWRTPNPRYVHP